MEKPFNLHQPSHRFGPVCLCYLVKRGFGVAGRQLLTSNVAPVGWFYLCMTSMCVPEIYLIFSYYLAVVPLNSIQCCLEILDLGMC